MCVCVCIGFVSKYFVDNLILKCVVSNYLFAHSFQVFLSNTNNSNPY